MYAWKILEEKTISKNNLLMNIKIVLRGGRVYFSKVLRKACNNLVKWAKSPSLLGCIVIPSMTQLMFIKSNLINLW
jgi:hypothetical protein